MSNQGEETPAGRPTVAVVFDALNLIALLTPDERAALARSIDQDTARELVDLAMEAARAQGQGPPAQRGGVGAAVMVKT